mmetsp:Transcript_26405/g.63702  ORF Transcript_26405/g.63702 Transcript_26405/m.63702 type:complete len:439 (-) Transcript_26405:403-1719(-)
MGVRPSVLLSAAAVSTSGPLATRHAGGRSAPTLKARSRRLRPTILRRRLSSFCCSSSSSLSSSSSSFSSSSAASNSNSSSPSPLTDLSSASIPASTSASTSASSTNSSYPWRDWSKSYHRFMDERPWQAVDDFYRALVRGDPSSWAHGLVPEPAFPDVGPDVRRRARKERFYILGIAYDGTAFEAFALNAHLDSVCGRIQNQIKNFLGGRLRIMVAGRTDKGVYGLGQILSFKTTKEIDLEKFSRAVFEDAKGRIRVWSSAYVHRSFNAWGDTESREYVYLFPLTPEEAQRKEKIERSCQILFGKLTNLTMSYNAFARRVKETENPDGKDVCTLLSCNITGASLPDGTPVIKIHLRGNRFLRQMVRVLVGTALWHACGQPWVWNIVDDVIPSGDPEMLLYNLAKSKDRTLTALAAPSSGLSLVSVKYPESHNEELTSE